MMKNQFKLLKEAVQKCNNPEMDIIVDLLEEYNKRLCGYFQHKEVSREFMDTIDMPESIKIFQEKFGEQVLNKNLALQQLMLDINTLARSTWYFERDDGNVFCGENLYKDLLVFMASTKGFKPIYANEEDAALAESLEDAVPEAFQKMIDGELVIIYREVIFPEPIGYQEIVVDLSGEERAATISEMVSLVEFHALVNEVVLNKYTKLAKYRSSSIDEQKIKLSLFWKTYFNLEIDWSNLFMPTAPEDFRVLEFIPRGVTLYQVFEAFDKYFPKNNLFMFWKEILKDTITEYEPRPMEDYVIIHDGLQSPAAGNFIIGGMRYYSIQNFKECPVAKGGFYTMLPIEFFLINFRFHAEFNEDYDTDRITNFNAEAHQVVSKTLEFDHQLRTDSFFKMAGRWVTNGRIIREEGPREMMETAFRRVYL